MDKIERAVDDIRRKWAPDGRLAVFEISLLPKGVGGVTSSRDARDALRRLAADAGLAVGERFRDGEGSRHDRPFYSAGQGSGRSSTPTPWR